MQKRIQKIERYCDDREVDTNYYNQMELRIGKKEHRAGGFIPVIVDYTSIYGAFGVGLVKK